MEVKVWLKMQIKLLQGMSMVAEKKTEILVNEPIT
jgi:hypothetical protein